MSLVSTGFANELEPILKTVFFNEYLTIPSKIDMVASMESSKKAKETMIGISGLGRFQKFEGTIPTTTPAEAYKKEVEHTRFAQSIEISKDLYDDDQTGVIKRMTQELAQMGKQTKEVNFWEILNHAADTTYTGGDSLALASTAHTSTIAGVANQSNLGTSALSHSSLATARLAMRKFKTWEGEPMVNIPDMVVVPMDLEETAIVALQSSLKSGTSYNDINVFQTNGWKFKILVVEHLEDTNNWALVNTMYSKKHLHYFTREPLNTFTDSSTTTLVMKWAATYRDSTGFTDWRWIYYNNVA